VPGKCLGTLWGAAKRDSVAMQTNNTNQGLPGRRKAQQSAPGKGNPVTSSGPQMLIPLGGAASRITF